jgi:hypothetical protein
MSRLTLENIRPSDFYRLQGNFEQAAEDRESRRREERDMERMKLKYVMTQNGPILFPGSFSHADFQAFAPTSAGFVEIGRDGSVYTYGQSASLKLRPDGQDESRIQIAVRGDYL